MSVYLFWGQEDYLLNKEIKRLKKEILDPAFAAMGYKTFDNPPFSELLECLQQPPSMFGKTLNIINADKYLTGSSISFDDKQIECIDSALSNLSPRVNFIFVCKIPRDENKRPDARKKIYKTLAKYAAVSEFAQYRNYDKQLPAVIVSIAQEKGLQPGSMTAQAVISQLGVNLNLIDSELEKLKTAVYPETKITPADVQKYCTSTEDIFALADTIIKGGKNEILKQYSLLTEKRHYLEVLAFLQSSLQKFIFIKSTERKMSSKEIAAKLKMHEFVLQKTQEKLRKISLERLIEIRENVLNAEYKMKSGRTAREDTALELALLS